MKARIVKYDSRNSGSTYFVQVKKWYHIRWHYLTRQRKPRLVMEEPLHLFYMGDCNHSSMEAGLKTLSLYENRKIADGDFDQVLDIPL